jgi:hypothetical protein
MYIGYDWMFSKNPCSEIPLEQNTKSTGYDKLECEKEKPTCKKCGGTGILDFEFYTRDCFDCKDEK